MIIRVILAAMVTVVALDQQQIRDTAAPPRIIVGTATVSGVVTLGDEAATPVRRAVVTLTAVDAVDSRSAITNDNGQFAVAGVPEGRYTLEAEKAAHLTMAFGARRPGRPGTALMIAAGQQVKDIQLTLPRGAVLGGTVTFDDGQPVPNALVLAIPARLSMAGGSSISTGREFRTDDTGTFRIYGLAPDTYIVGVLPQFGRGEVERRTTGDNDALLRLLQQPATAGRAAGQPSPLAIPTPSVIGYAPTYFPGTPIAADAQHIPLRSGNVRDDLSFTVQMWPMATVRGVVTGEDGAPTAAVSIQVETLGPTLPLASALARRVNRPNTRGEYSVVGLAPGRHVIRARGGGVAGSETGGFSIRMADQTLWAAAVVNVSGETVEGIGLTLRPGAVFSGAITGAPGAGASWAGVTVQLQPERAAGDVAGELAGGVAARSATVDEQGRFIVMGLEPGHYTVRVTLPSRLADGWSLRHALHHGRDVRDTPLTFASGSLEGVEIALTRSLTVLSGTLTSASGTPATDYYVVVFPDDRGLWHPTSPRITALRPAADGTFSTRLLPAGTYRIAALTDVEDHELNDRTFLESIYEAGIVVRLTEGTTTRQEVRLR